NYVSVTPLHVDLTAHQSLDTLTEWMENSGEW
ncbi:MAG: 5'/3'-nucleotidase SurE, partial [Plesiomonas shigelloides]